jgi:Asp-tRNA(Asn)/Glu-tRNA(Gln) amidotransferase A subunit family amidase
LSGLRVAVKDAFDIKGTKTSLCNKAYHDLYPESFDTAAAVSSLTRRGAAVVGKTKLNSLISKEDPTEAVDYSAPFNPRADGYQSPAGSSSGSAAAIAAYYWLDVAIGTDSMSRELLNKMMN